ncbi:MAG: hypothetical protein K6T83_23400, partial [Alicyclobacillus sp.]|nr:hypothetical protein [Alicyclobacillus sp.]
MTLNPFRSAETMTGHMVRFSGGDLSYDSIDYNSIFAIGLLLFLITASTFSSLGVVLPAMIKEQQWSFASAFLGFTLLGAFCGGSSWLPAILIRKIGVRATIVVGSAVMVAGFVCLATARGLP